MPLLAVISLIFQVFFLIHILRTGRDRYWIWIVIFFPGVGCLVYFLVEFLPDFQYSAGQSIRRNRNKSLRYLKDEVEHTPSIKNKKLLAEAYVNSGHFEDAIELYVSCLEGIHENDPGIMEGLGLASFFNSEFEKAEHYLTKAIALRDTERTDQFDLLLARTYEALGQTEKALEAFSILSKTYAGEEARCRYALLLKQLGRTDEATQIFEQIIKNVKISPKYYRRQQNQWLRIAKSEK